MSVFLSYRRVDSAYALWIYPWLIQWFGQDRVFWDRKDIAPGQDFAAVIEAQIRASRAFITLVSEHWLGAADAAGERRIDAPDDWIRRETTLALELGIPLLPVLVGGTKAPQADDLPVGMQPLAKLHMFSMADMSFHETLRETLQQCLPARAARGRASGEQAARLQRRAASLLRRQVLRLQVRAVELIQDGKLDRATEELNEGSELLMNLLDLLPGDAGLDAQLGYLFGTTGQALKAAGDLQQAEHYFDLALSVFERGRAVPHMFSRDPLVTASDLKGIGGVYYERGDPVTAISYYRAALGIDPLYAYAWHDLFAAYDLLARRGAINLAGMLESLGKTRETGAGQPGLGADKLETFERMLQGWQQQARLRPQLQINDGAARLVPAGLTLVLGEARPELAAFNLDCEWVHQLAARVAIRSLLAKVTSPKRRTRRFEATVVYRNAAPAPARSRTMVAGGQLRGTEVEAGYRAMGIHLSEAEPGPGKRKPAAAKPSGADPAGAVFWSAGRYRFELQATIENPASGDSGIVVKTSFIVEVGRYEASQVRLWAAAPKDHWDRLNDADRAVGIPVQIDRSSIVTSA